MNPQELRKLLETKIPEFIASGGKLAQWISRYKNECCALGALHWLENKDSELIVLTQNLTLWLEEKYHLNREDIYNFMDGFDNSLITRKNEFFLLGKEIKQKYL